MVIKKSLVLSTFFLILIGVIFALPFVLAFEPTGATPGYVKSTTAPNDTALSNNALAGNVTEMSIFGFTTTQAWQGYYGNVTGVIQLADSNDYVMYNWTVASPLGEVFASTNQTITWPYIQCLNFSSSGSYDPDTAQAGGTSYFGTNETVLEIQYNISSRDDDGVNETFRFSAAAGGGHRLFYVANKEFSIGECQSTRIYSGNGVGEADKFEEVLQYEPTTASVIFTALLNQDVAGFDTATHDYEMLVLDNGHGTDTATTPYYFFVELQ